MMVEEGIQQKQHNKLIYPTYSLYLFHCTDIPSAAYNLIANPIYLVTCFGICCEIIIVSGFIVFLPKFLETQFGSTKSVANILTGRLR